MVENFCLSLLVGACVIQAYFCVFVFWRLLNYPSLSNTQSTEVSFPVSVVICAKNEASNLAKNLPFVLAQKYNNTYEVLIINDDSEDESAEILAKMAAKYPHLRVLNTAGLDRKMSGKKHALNFGINEAKYDILLLTDADCEPSSYDWLSYMVQNLNDNSQKQIVLGVSPYFTQKKHALLNIVIQYETAYTALQYLSFALWGVPYMGVGRNLAYRKTIFRAANGFAAHQNVASGDDDLLIGSAATAQNTSIEIRPAAYCYSQPPSNWFMWFKQKKRHLSAGKHYAQKHQARLGLLVFSHVMLYLSIITCIFVAPYSLVIILSLLFVLLKSLLLSKIFGKLQLNIPFYQTLIGDFLLFLYYIILIPMSLLTKQTSWK